MCDSGCLWVTTLDRAWSGFPRGRGWCHVTWRSVTRCMDDDVRYSLIKVLPQCHRALQNQVKMPLVTQRDPNTTRMALRSVTVAELVCPRCARGVPNHLTENENSP